MAVAGRHLRLVRVAPASGDRTLAGSAIAVVAGALLSGPIGMAIAALVPQPPWRDAATFAAHFHPLQQLPYAFGFLLIGASILFVVRAAALLPDSQRTRAYAAVACAGSFGAMIGINYTLQLAWVPHAARAHDPALAYIAMANPGALGWALELFGYVALGAATWIVAPAFREARFGRAIRALLVANGVLSAAGAVVTAIDLTWVMSTAGLIAFAVWNALYIAVMLLVAAAFLPRR
ncbi:MAG: hypothetical protein ACXVAN_09445 [Polyangia bacterium]